MSLFGSLKEELKLLEKFYSSSKNNINQIVDDNSSSSSSSISSSSSSGASTSSSTTTSTSNSTNYICNCFHLISVTLDEIVCEFIDSTNKKYRINANIPVSMKMQLFLLI
jgi:hypothetical protein